MGVGSSAQSLRWAYFWSSHWGGSRPSERWGALFNDKINLAYPKQELRERFENLLEVSQKLFESKRAESHTPLQDPKLLQIQQGLALFDATEKQSLSFEEAFQALFPDPKDLSKEKVEKICEEAKNNLERVKQMVAVAHNMEKFLAHLG